MRTAPGGDPALTAPAAEGGRRACPLEGSRLRDATGDHSSVGGRSSVRYSTFGDYAHRCVVRLSRHRRATTRESPSDVRELLTTLPTLLSLIDTRRRSRPSTLESIVRRRANPVIQPWSWCLVKRWSRLVVWYRTGALFGISHSDAYVVVDYY